MSKPARVRPRAPHVGSRRIKAGCASSCTAARERQLRRIERAAGQRRPRLRRQSSWSPGRAQAEVRPEQRRRWVSCRRGSLRHWSRAAASVKPRRCRDRAPQPSGRQIARRAAIRARRHGAAIAICIARRGHSDAGTCAREMSLVRNSPRATGVGQARLRQPLAVVVDEAAHRDEAETCDLKENNVGRRCRARPAASPRADRTDLRARVESAIASRCRQHCGTSMRWRAPQKGAPACRRWLFQARPFHSRGGPRR